MTHKSVVAQHIASGTIKTFDNVVEREEYISSEIRKDWVFYFIAPNGYKYGYE